MFLISSCSCIYPISWSQVLSLEWRCSWSSTDRWCSNFIRVINNFIADYDAAYIRGLTVFYIVMPFLITLSLICYSHDSGMPQTRREYRVGKYRVELQSFERLALPVLKVKQVISRGLSSRLWYLHCWHWRYHSLVIFSLSVLKVK